MYTNKGNLNNVAMELRKCCIHPYLIRGAEDHIIKELKETDPQKVINSTL